MPVVIRKKPQPDTTKTVELAKHAAPPFKMNETEFLAMMASDEKGLKDWINRHTTAVMFGITVRTLDRWHDRDYGPKRKRKFGRYTYSRAEVEAWIAEHGRGSRRPRSPHKAAFNTSYGETAPGGPVPR